VASQDGRRIGIASISAPKEDAVRQGAAPVHTATESRLPMSELDLRFGSALLLAGR